MEILNEYGKTAAQYARDHKKQVQKMIRTAIERDRTERADRVEPLPVKQPGPAVFMTARGPAYRVEKSDRLERIQQRITLPWCSIQGR